MTIQKPDFNQIFASQARIALGLSDEQVDMIWESSLV